jgi:hypothetical protein
MSEWILRVESESGSEKILFCSQGTASFAPLNKRLLSLSSYFWDILSTCFKFSCGWKAEEVVELKKQASEREFEYLRLILFFIS